MTNKKRLEAKGMDPEMGEKSPPF